MEAQHIGLSQIHAAQPELLQEEVDTRTHSLELKLQEQSDHEDRGEGICSLCASGKAEVSFKMLSTLSFMIQELCVQHSVVLCWSYCVCQQAL